MDCEYGTLENPASVDNSDWVKVLGYIEKGSCFNRVAFACRNNRLKLVNRYLILKEIGLLEHAGFFYDYLPNSRKKTLEQMHIEIPDWAAEKIDAYQSANFGPFARVNSNHRQVLVTDGSLTELYEMGVRFDLFRGDLKDDEEHICEGMGISRWTENFFLEEYDGKSYYIWHIGVLYNTKTVFGDNHFYLLRHCNNDNKVISWGISLYPNDLGRAMNDKRTPAYVRTWIRGSIKPVTFK